MGRNRMRKVIEKSVVKSLQFYWRRTRALTMGAQGIVVDGEGRVLLIRHIYRPAWHFPGGGVERGETVETALMRELQEEAGIICDGRPELFGLYANFRAFPSDHIAVFIIRHWAQPEVPAPNREIAAQVFAMPDALPDGTIEPVRRRLDELAGAREQNEHW